MHLKYVIIDNEPHKYNLEKGTYQKLLQQEVYVQPQQVFRVQPLQFKQEPNYQLQKNNHTNSNMLDMFESAEFVVCSLHSSTCSIDDITRDNWSKKITTSNNNSLPPENNFTKACKSPYDESNSSEANNSKSTVTFPGSSVSNQFATIPLQNQRSHYKLLLI